MFPETTHMEIIKQVAGRTEIFRLKGRIDAFWSEKLANSLDESIGLGFRHFELNLAGVDYLSSAGIRVLLKYLKQLKASGGMLSVTEPSVNAKSILEIAGLAALLSASAVAGQDAKPENAQAAIEPKFVSTPKATFQAYELPNNALLKCELVGNLDRLKDGEFDESDCAGLTFPAGTFGLGCGAFGADFHDCRSRFGEFLALAGITAYQPADSTHAPDYVVSEGDLVPEIKALYALQAHGPFSHRVHFEAKPEPPGAIDLSEVVRSLLEISCADLLGVVMLAEASDVVGATLRKADSTNPAVTDEEGLSYRVEKMSERVLCVIVGVACGRELARLATVLDAVGPEPAPVGHFHAAVFPYHPISRGELDLYSTVNSEFSSGAIQGLYHLQTDPQAPESGQETSLLRGVCWIGRIKDISSRRP